MKIIRITESDLTRIVKRSINEMENRKDDLYSRINRIIDDEFDDLDSSKIYDVLINISSHHKNKNSKKFITPDEVRKNFKKR